MPLPAPLPAWAKAALYLAPFAYAAGEALFDALAEHDSAEQLAWLHAVYSGTRLSPTGTTEDRAQISFDVVHLAGGENDPDWTAARVTQALGYLDHFFQNAAGYQSDNFTWTECRAYVRRFNSVGPGFADMGDPVSIRSLNTSGSSSQTNEYPYQVAMSITEKTTLRKHWGRIYLPCPASNSTNGYGRWFQSVCDALAVITSDTYALLSTNSFAAVVPSAATRTLFTVTQIQVDDIPDVQRRRRARQTLVRSVSPA